MLFRLQLILLFACHQPSPMLLQPKEFPWLLLTSHHPIPRPNDLWIPPLLRQSSCLTLGLPSTQLLTTCFHLPLALTPTAWPLATCPVLFYAPRLLQHLSHLCALENRGECLLGADSGCIPLPSQSLSYLKFCPCIWTIYFSVSPSKTVSSLKVDTESNPALYLQS